MSRLIFFVKKQSTTYKGIKIFPKEQSSKRLFTPLKERNLSSFLLFFECFMVDMCRFFEKMTTFGIGICLKKRLNFKKL